MFHLDDKISEIQGIGERFIPKLKHLHIETVKDLLWHFPFRYEDYSEIYPIADLAANQEATIQGAISEIGGRRSWRRRLYITEALINDDTGSIRAVWFNQPYIRNTLRPGRIANFSGKVSFSDGELYLSNPTYELTPQARTYADHTQTDAEGQRGSASISASVHDWKHTARVVPIYPETKGLTSKGLRYLIKPILDNLETMPEIIPKNILGGLEMPDINEAVREMHFPSSIDSALLAKKRFAFEDLFLLQLYNIKQKMILRRERAIIISRDIESVKSLLKLLPFTLTETQKKSLWEILQDLEKPHPMNRLLQGDVGSGKTVVAAIAAIAAARDGYQSAFMAPTEILARQHYETFKKFFSSLKIPFALVTGSNARAHYEDGLENKTTRASIIKEIGGGALKIVIGTHALIQKGVDFPKLAFVVVDEQHRFGVKQRAELAARGHTRTETQTNADIKLLYEDLTYQIRGAAFEVKKQLGLGHKETVYQRALGEELVKREVGFAKEKTINIKYLNKNIGTYQPDFIIEDKVIVELKALPYVGEAHQKQLWSYLKGSPYKLALLINFGARDIEIRRVVYDSARSPRQSASSQRESALVPHFLSMSATPIPRTLSLTLFGDLDLSLITELPSDRKPITTKVVEPEDRKRAYAFIRSEVKKGRQVFVICPRIDAGTPINTDNGLINADNESVSISQNPHKSALLFEIKSVKEEYEKLSKKVFPDLRVGMLHGKLKPKEKEKIMSDFKNNKINILVSTSVVEVGVDIPNATIMMIESTERFGLAQLYQFRGRVGRGAHQSYCLLFTDAKGDSVKRRLKSIVEAKNGFELAEKDLAIRGPGQFLGAAQTGMPDLAMKAIQNPELVKTAREAALATLESDPNLSRSAGLKERILAFERLVHWE